MMRFCNIFFYFKLTSCVMWLYTVEASVNLYVHPKSNDGFMEFKADGACRTHKRNVKCNILVRKPD